MPHPIETMKRKRHRHQELHPHLHRRGEFGERSGEGGGFDVQAQEGGDEVGEAEDVEGTGEDGAGDAV